jgi:galacturan 1,4-alpha-galacturonidase
VRSSCKKSYTKLTRNSTIGNPLQIELHDAILDVHGWISYSTDIDNWIAKRYKFDYQNLALAWVITGSNITLDGNGVGGIFGNGQAWYNWAKDEGNKFGRPMALALVNVTNALVRDWSILQPPFWSAIVIDSDNVWFHNYYANATNFNDDPAAKAHIHTWLQNTDGYDVYRSRNCGVINMTYQGGDDCLSIKPNVSDFYARNVSCYGGTGIAFGSIAQYPGVMDWIENVTMDGINLYPSTQHVMKNGLYFKSWMG